MHQKSRKHYLIRRLRMQNFFVKTRRKRIVIYLEDFNSIISNRYAYELIREYDFKLYQNRQLKLF